ncbi:MAG: RluA family pseudouridine synthase [Planctomycetota bacterium]
MCQERENLLARLTTPLPGSVAYTNVRPMNVPLRFDKSTVIDFLTGMHQHLDQDHWLEKCQNGLIRYKQQPVLPDTIVRAGWRIENHIPQTVEPDVNNYVSFLYEDSEIVVVNKPAPLPMHACGRFNRNTLSWFVNQVFAGEQIRVIHRLDSNTTGVVIMARKKSAAQAIHSQFKACSVEKVYFARVTGMVNLDQFECHQPISPEASTAGSRNIDSDSGLKAFTRFEQVHQWDDRSTLLKCFPITGRTNQIRVHLHSLGLPIVGDPTYRGSSDPPNKQTLTLDDPPMCLHAASITFLHPLSGKRMTFEAPLPDWTEAQNENTSL